MLIFKTNKIMNNYIENLINSDTPFNLELLQLLTSHPELYSSNKDDIHSIPSYVTNHQPRLPVRRLAPLMPKPSTNTVSPPTTPTPIKIKAESIPTEVDQIALKRMRNTDAARRSRLKKVARMEQLETQVSELESDRSQLTTRIAVLETQKHALLSQDLENQARIRALEAQLADVHKALTE